MALSNDELIKLRSRMYRGYRAPLAVTEVLNKPEIVSMSRDGNGNVQQLVQTMAQPDGTTITWTTDFALDGNGNIQSSTITYSYDDTTP